MKPYVPQAMWGQQKAEGDLMWFWNNADAELGLQSNFGPMVNRLNGMTGGRDVIRHEMDPIRLEAARRSRSIQRALNRAGGDVVWVLKRAFAPSEFDGPYHADLGGLGHLAGIALDCAATITHHRKSNTARSRRAWLSRLLKAQSNRMALQEIRYQSEILLEGALRRYIDACGKRDE